MSTVPAKASQNFVPIKEIRDGVVILQDGSFRAILMSSSTNFALKSEDSQEAIIAQFQDFLNSLDFSIQIFIQSRRFDIGPYLALLNERFKASGSELLKVQTREYIDFIKTFTESTNIMTKSFFVVVPFSPSAASIKSNPLTALSSLGGLSKSKGAQNNDDKFMEKQIQLDQRVSVVEQGLSRCGLRVVRLGSEEIIELYYKLFNPGEAGAPKNI